MADLPIMPLMTDALESDTASLSHERYGQYMRLLVRWWRDGCRPSTIEYLAEISGVEEDDIGKLRRFLTETEGGWIQKKLFEIYARQMEKSRKAKDAAAKRWKCDGNANAYPDASAKGDANASANAHAPRDADAMQESMPSMNHEPTSISKDMQRGAQKRASRLPEDFALPSKWREWAKSKGFSENQISSEFEKMRNWSQYAKNGACRDWYRRWQNWLSDKSPAHHAPPVGDVDPLLKHFD